ncbi:MAG: NAD(P)/FAD-dependent oxidoreductase [Betaproteobacteria bacterium]|nr:NAD(P)/FAD-dependent oxidoreductase [Betaproteobacteria bacterium]
MASEQKSTRELHKIVIVGGGAGGLELATQLGRTLGRRRRALITLVDRSRTHLWKPLLHQVAAGSMDLNDHELDYLYQARWHHFQFRLGRMDGLDRATKEIHLAPTFDEAGREVLPARGIAYDTLVLAVGSTTNDFGTPGATEHAISLDNPQQAALFHSRLLNACLRANAQQGRIESGQLHIAIIGAGATGVELAAELHNTIREFLSFGLDRINPERDIKITIVEAAPKILPALSERLSNAVLGLLKKLNVEVLTGERVTEVSPRGVKTATGREIPAELVVWAAGIKAPDFLKDIGALETNRINQLVVTQALQTTRDVNIFAFGDCASCPWPEKKIAVPPRAQSAHQQASHLTRMLPRHLHGEPLRPYAYRDFGSLISLGKFSTIGSLMGAITRGSVMIEGFFAKIMYLSLYKMHELALHGFTKVFLDTLARIITRRTGPHIKLH